MTQRVYCCTESPDKTAVVVKTWGELPHCMRHAIWQSASLYRKSWSHQLSGDCISCCTALNSLVIENMSYNIRRDCRTPSKFCAVYWCHMFSSKVTWAHAQLLFCVQRQWSVLFCFSVSIWFHTAIKVNEPKSKWKCELRGVLDWRLPCKTLKFNQKNLYM